MIGECYNTCASCFNQQDPLSCLTCKAGSMYILSCQIFSTDYSSVIFVLTLVIVIMAIVLFVTLMLMGIGIFREAYENLQLMALISWGFGLQDDATIITWLNLGTISKGVQFAALVQFFVVVFLLIAFVSVGIILQRRTNTAFSLMFRRKKFIFPFRLYTFFYNFFVMSTIIQLLYLIKGVNVNISSFLIAFLCMIFFLTGLVLIILKLNFSKAQLEDPRFYAFVEKQVSTKLRVKNQIVFSLLTRLVIIAGFCGAFSNPLVAEIIMLVAQGIYIVYFAVCVRYTKIWYWCINFASNLLLLVSLVCACQYARSMATDVTSIIWLVNMLIFSIMFIVAVIVEMVKNWMQIKRHIRSVYVRFLLLEKEQQQVTLNKYDDNYNKQRVTQFVDNPLHSKVRPLIVDESL